MADVSKIKCAVVAAAKKYPYGKSILLDIMESCVLQRGTQWLMLGITAVLLVGALPALPGLADDTSWDARNGVPSHSLPWAVAVPLLERSLGLSRAVLAVAALLSAAPLLWLWRADGPHDGGADAHWAQILPAALQSRIFGGARGGGGDKDCYFEMFSEAGASGAARQAAGYLVAAPGNTYSNLIYYFTGIVVLVSSLAGASLGGSPSRTTPFWAPDALYGALVLALAVFSTGWHATNRPVFHYPDLATMECSIAYLIIRVPCSAARAPGLCLALYCLAAALIFRHKRGWRDARVLHHSCPFAARWRLFHNGTKGNEDLGIAGVCLYATLPVIYLALPFGTQVFALRNSGSVVAFKWAVSTLAAGWGYRMWERFCLDGNVLMDLACKHTRDGTGAARTVVAAIVSPTAVLHWTTGLTLLFAYAGARTLEQ